MTIIDYISESVVLELEPEGLQLRCAEQRKLHASAHNKLKATHTAHKVKRVKVG